MHHNPRRGLKRRRPPSGNGEQPALRVRGPLTRSATQKLSSPNPSPRQHRRMVDPRRQQIPHQQLGKPRRLPMAPQLSDFRSGQFRSRRAPRKHQPMAHHRRNRDARRHTTSRHDDVTSRRPRTLRGRRPRCRRMHSTIHRNRRTLPTLDRDTRHRRKLHLHRRHRRRRRMRPNRSLRRRRRPH